MAAKKNNLPKTNTIGKNKKLPAPRYEVKRANNKELYWRFIGKNGEQISRSSETYKRMAGVMKSINIMKNTEAVIVDK